MENIRSNNTNLEQLPKKKPFSSFLIENLLTCENQEQKKSVKRKLQNVEENTEKKDSYLGKNS